MARDNQGEGEDKIVPLPSGYVPHKPPATRPGVMHGAATIAMAAFAVIGFLAMFAFITIGWPGASGRYVIAIVVFAGVGFLASAAIAVFAAARDTYPSRSNDREAN
jgi:membrane protein implicated in regulation of membrane protease activity